MGQPLRGELLPPPGPGRPSNYNLKVLAKLIEAFQHGFNNKEAAWYAGISEDTYYEWKNTKPGFSELMDEAKSSVRRLAKFNIVKGMRAGDTNLSKWWLEHTDPEFKNKVEVETPDSSKHDETRDKIKDFLDAPTSYSGEAESDAAGGEPTTADAETGRVEVAPAPTDIS